MYSFFVIFNCDVFSALYAKYFEIWKRKLWKWWVDCFIAQSINWCDVFGCFIVNPFSPLWSIFFSRKLCSLWSPCLLIIAESISLDTSRKLIVGFFLKITSPSWIILSISLDELNSVDRLLKSWWWIFLKWFLF